MPVSINGTTGLITAGASSSGGGGVASNTALGGNALQANTSGANNTALGNEALQANTTASDNTAVGYQALYTNTTGTAVTALGYKAGYASTGSVSVYVGYNCGVAATGSSNTFIGSGAGEGVTSGAANTIVGRFNGNQGGLDIRTASNYIVLSDGSGVPELIMGGGYNGFVNQQIVTSNTKGGTVNILSIAQIFPTDNTITSAILLVTAGASEGTSGGYTRSDVIFISKRFGNQISATNIGSSDGISSTNWTYGYDGSNFRVTQNWSAGGSTLGTRWSILVVSGANVG